MGVLTDLFFQGAANNAQQNAASRAAQASQYATDQSTGLQRDIFNQTRTDYAPWRTAGTNALSNLSDPTKAFQASPDYQFRLKQGLDSVTQNRAVNGLLKSGSALSALNDRASNIASGEYGDWWNRQAGLAGLGQTATAGTAAAGASYANGSQNALMLNANNQANSSYYKGNALAGFYGGVNGTLNSAAANMFGGGYG